MTAEVYRAAGHAHGRARACCRASRTRAAGGPPSRPTRRRSTCWCARSSGPATCPGEEVAISLDVAASEFGRGRPCTGWVSKQRELDRDGLAEYLLGWCERYPVLSIEDPLAEDDPVGLAQVHGRDRPQGAGHRRRCPGDQCGARRGRGPATAPSMPCWSRSTRPAPSARPGRPARRDNGPASARSCRRARGNRRRRHRASGDRLGGRPVEGRLVRPLRAHGQMERGSANRGSARCPRPFRRNERLAVRPLLAPARIRGRLSAGSERCP